MTWGNELTIIASSVKTASYFIFRLLFSVNL
jgi:hypothetical protein